MKKIRQDIFLFHNNFRQQFAVNIRFHPYLRSKRLIKYLFGPNWHPMGTTRLGENPQNSITDSNLELHGVKGVFVLSPSVFPTGSNSNPTFTTLALAQRLVAYIKTN